MNSKSNAVFASQESVKPYHPKNHTGTTNYRFFGEAGGAARNLEVLLGVIEAGQGTKPHRHPGVEQVCYLVEGTARILVSGEDRVLEAGDCCYFPANAPHLFSVLKGPAKVLVIYAPPYLESSHKAEVVDSVDEVTADNQDTRRFESAFVLKSNPTSTGAGLTVNPLIGPGKTQAQYLEVVRVTIGANGGALPLYPDAERVCYVVSGRLRMRVGDQEREMNTGECVFFPSHCPHHMSAVQGTATLLAVMSPPVRERRSEWDPRLYDERHGFVWEYGGEVIELLAPKPGERILDIGCGTGHLTARLATLGVNVIGIDNSEAMLARATALYPGVHFENLPIEASTYTQAFDAVFSNATLHWIKRPELVITIIERALKPGGRFVAEFGGKGNLSAICRAMDAACGDVLGLPFESPWYFPSVSEYATLLEQAGLRCEYARLADRAVALQGQEGLRQWLLMYLKDTLDLVSEDRQEDFFLHVEAAAKSQLYRDGKWWVDHRRLRVKAMKPDAK